MSLITAFHPQSNGQAKKTILTLENMLRACVLNYGCSLVDRLSLIELAYNNSYHSSIGMAYFEALYGRMCRSPIGWCEVGEAEMFGLDFVHQVMDKVKVIQDRLKSTQSYQKSYTGVRQRELEFSVGDSVFLNVSPMKRVMQFGKKGNISP